ncbi:TRAP transporter small permease [Chelatococcus sp. GCM10030263]|uniref:TRAP transporter small permease n=1 Tax=Chelatococcus sp. GCM10030263 TaxID=3273387 RepID=UPI0036180E63
MWRALARLENFIAGTALVVLSAVVLIGVIFRYVLNYPLSWTEETSLIAFAWLMFFGAAICARENGHVLIDLIAPRPGSGFHHFSEALAAAVAAIVSAVLVWVSWRYTVGAAPMVTPIFRLSSAAYNAAAPVGFLLITVHMIRLCLLSIMGRETTAQPEEGI